MLIGIDLGTNNTVLSYYENGHLHVINKAIPSIVSVENNIVTIGEDALLLNHHKNLKRKLTNNPKVLYLYQAFLTKIKEIIDNFVVSKEYQVVVTVPAYFSESDKDITKRAILGAGLPLIRLLAEPTAAGIAYGHFHHTVEEVILVFDMGAGTTDLTLMRKSIDEETTEKQNNFYEVISIMGDVKFGGLDITELLRKLLPSNIDPEQSKINLSSGDISELSQKKYFSILEENYTENIYKLFDTILKDGKINKKEVNQIILIGGSTKNPYIRKTVSNYFQRDLDHIIDPDTAVSFGATIYGNSLLAKDNTVVLVDRLPMSIGIEVDNGKYAVLIEKNSIVPIKKESYFTTQEDNQEYINVKIYQGEHNYVKDNCLMGVFDVLLSELRPKATVKINVVAEINPDGILIVKAKDKNVEKSLYIKTIRNDDIERYVTILPQELLEEQYEQLNSMYDGIRQQILFQLEENIYLKIDSNVKRLQLESFYKQNEIIERLLNTFSRDEKIEQLEENISEIKKLYVNIESEFSTYLNNYIISDNWIDKLEKIMENIDTYNLSETNKTKIIMIIEEIIKEDNKNCEILNIQLGELLEFDFLN